MINNILNTERETVLHAIHTLLQTCSFFFLNSKICQITVRDFDILKPFFIFFKVLACANVKLKKTVTIVVFFPVNISTSAQIFDMNNDLFTEVISTCLLDAYPKVLKSRRGLVTTAVCILLFLLGLPCVTGVSKES